MKADARTEAAVMNVVKQCFEAFAKRDLDAMLAFFAPDPDVVLIGTGHAPISIYRELKRVVKTLPIGRVATAIPS